MSLFGGNCFFLTCGIWMLKLQTIPHSTCESELKKSSNSSSQGKKVFWLNEQLEVRLTQFFPVPENYHENEVRKLNFCHLIKMIIHWLTFPKCRILFYLFSEISVSCCVSYYPCYWPHRASIIFSLGIPVSPSQWGTFSIPWWALLNKDKPTINNYTAQEMRQKYSGKK